MTISKVNNFIHDLNQPLQIIIGKANVSLLDVKKNELDQAKLTDTLSSIVDSANRIIELTHQLQFEINESTK